MLFNNSNNSLTYRKSLTLFSVLLLLINISLTLAKKNKKSKAPKKAKNFTSRVLNLTDDTFAEFNSTNKQFYLYFMTNKCKKCDIFNPKFDELSDLLQKTQYKIPCVRVNLDENKKLQEHYEINSTPKLFFANYEDNDFHEYHGKNSPKTLINYVNHQLNYTTEEVKNWEDVQKKKKNGYYLIFVGDVQKYAEIYKKIIKAAREEDIDRILWTTSEEIYDKFSINKNSFDVVMLKKSKKNLEVKGNLNVRENHTVKELENLMEIYERKLWGKADDYSVLLSLESGAPTPSLFVIYSAKNKEQKEYNKEINSLMDKISKKYIREFHFLNFTLGSNLATPFIKVFNLTRANAPYLVLVNDNQKYDDDVDKYIFPIDQKINEENVEKFLDDFKQNKLNKITFSDPVHVNGTFRNGINNLIGKDYENFLFKENLGKDCLFYLYSEFNQHANVIHNRVKNVIQKLEGNSHLVFARINPLFNEIQDFQYSDLPTIFLIKGNTESERRNNIKKLELKNFLTKKIVDFVKENSSNTVTEKPLENEEELFKNEDNDLVHIVHKQEEEDMIDFDVYNAGLRRYTRYILEGDDDDDEEKEKEDKKRESSRRKEDL